MDEWLKLLGQLTGEEIYNLTCELERWITLLADSGKTMRRNDRRLQPANRMMVDLLELRNEVLMQVARITVPMIEAQNIVYRARFARGHPIRMNPEL